MPPQRSSSKRTHHPQPPPDPYTPSPDANTYRDLLIFEERLKQNAARLHARKNKYETLLAVFVGFVLFLSYHVFIDRKESVPLHYFILSLLLICLTTLFLFFASGMHAERIRAANKFVPQANRSLRSFNMYLNTRTYPRRRSFFSLFSSSSSSSAPSASSPSLSSRNHAHPSNASTAAAAAVAPRRSAIPPIPPSQNPRGELIFSTRVSADFRDGYERYRAAFERRRAEKMAAKRARSWKRWVDWLLWPLRRSVKRGAVPSVQVSSHEAKAMGRSEGVSGGTRHSETRRRRGTASKRNRERRMSASSTEGGATPSSLETPDASSPESVEPEPEPDQAAPTSVADAHEAKDAQQLEQLVQARNSINGGGGGALLQPSSASAGDAGLLGPDWIEVKRSGSRSRASHAAGSVS
ncbi:hypothetical protein ACQY0O_005866 [Thecaphora frezii]